MTLKIFVLLRANLFFLLVEGMSDQGVRDYWKTDRCWKYPKERLGKLVPKRKVLSIINIESCQKENIG